MGFTMKHGLSPFHQEQKPAKLTMPIEPDWNAPEYQGYDTEKVEVTQGKPKGRVIRKTISDLKAKLGSNVLTGDVSTTEGYTSRSGSWLGNALTGSGYNVTKNFGSADVQGALTGNTMDEGQSKKFYSELKSVLKEGQGAQIVDGQITPGGTHLREVQVSKKGKAKRAFYDAKNAYNKQENQAKEAERQAKIQAERQATTQNRAKAIEDKKREAEGKVAAEKALNDAAIQTREKAIEDRRKQQEAARNAKYPNQPATNEPVAQQNRSAFYQKGMMADKMYLKNENKKSSATSPLNQNKLTNEKLVGSKTTTERGSLEGRPGTFTTTVNDYETPGSGNKNTKEKMSNTEWSKFVKENPNWSKGGNRSDQNRSFKPDLEKPMDLPTPAPTTFSNELTNRPIKPIPTPVTPTEKPKPQTFNLNVGIVKQRGAEGKSGSAGTGGGAAKKYGCPGGCP
jgi:hypothetical protein